MLLVGAGAILVFAVMAVALLAIHARAEVLTLAFAFVSVVGSLVMARLIKHYEAMDARREREATLLR